MKRKQYKGPALRPGRRGEFDPYLRAITEEDLPLLTAEQEVRLARRVESGDAEARAILFNANIRLVRSIAVRYKSDGITYEDMVQEGSIGLLHAIEKYNWRMGNRFSTYATHWIRQAVGRGIEGQGKTIRQPSYAQENMRKMHAAMGALYMELQRTPTNAEIAERCGVNVARVRELNRPQCMEPVSLDAKFNDSASTLGEVLPGDPSLQPHTAIFNEEDRRQIHRAMSILTPREREVLILRYGIGEDSEGALTLDGVGKALHLSRERARQLEREALRKLGLNRKLRDTVLT